MIGGDFGGLTAALEVKAELGSDVGVTVVSAADRFLFNQSPSPVGLSGVLAVALSQSGRTGEMASGLPHRRAMTAGSPCCPWSCC